MENNNANNKNSRKYIKKTTKYVNFVHKFSTRPRNFVHIGTDKLIYRRFQVSNQPRVKYPISQFNTQFSNSFVVRRSVAVRRQRFNKNAEYMFISQEQSSKHKPIPINNLLFESNYTLKSFDNFLKDKNQPDDVAKYGTSCVDNSQNKTLINTENISSKFPITKENVSHSNFCLMKQNYSPEQTLLFECSSASLQLDCNDIKHTEKKFDGNLVSWEEPIENDNNSENFDTKNIASSLIHKVIKDLLMFQLTKEMNIESRIDESSNDKIYSSMSTCSSSSSTKEYYLPALSSSAETLHVANVLADRKPFSVGTNKYINVPNKYNDMKRNIESLNQRAKKLGKLYQTTNKVGKLYQTSNKVGKLYHTSNKVGKLDQTSNKLCKLDQTSNKLCKLDQTSNKLRKLDQTSNKLYKLDQTSTCNKNLLIKDVTQHIQKDIQDKSDRTVITIVKDNSGLPIFSFNNIFNLVIKNNKTSQVNEDERKNTGMNIEEVKIDPVTYESGNSKEENMKNIPKENIIIDKCHKNDDSVDNFSNNKLQLFSEIRKINEDKSKLKTNEIYKTWAPCEDKEDTESKVSNENKSSFYHLNKKSESRSLQLMGSSSIKKISSCTIDQSCSASTISNKKSIPENISTPFSRKSINFPEHKFIKLEPFFDIDFNHPRISRLILKSKILAGESESTLGEKQDSQENHESMSGLHDCSENKSKENRLIGFSNSLSSSGENFETSEKREDESEEEEIGSCSSSDEIVFTDSILYGSKGFQKIKEKFDKVHNNLVNENKKHSHHILDAVSKESSIIVARQCLYRVCSNSKGMDISIKNELSMDSISSTDYLKMNKTRAENNKAPRPRPIHHVSSAPLAFFTYDCGDADSTIRERRIMSTLQSHVKMKGKDFRQKEINIDKNHSELTKSIEKTETTECIKKSETTECIKKSETTESIKKSKTTENIKKFLANEDINKYEDVKKSGTTEDIEKSGKIEYTEKSGTTEDIEISGPTEDIEISGPTEDIEISGPNENIEKSETSEIIKKSEITESIKKSETSDYSISDMKLQLSNKKCYMDKATQVNIYIKDKNQDQKEVSIMAEISKIEKDKTKIELNKKIEKGKFLLDNGQPVILYNSSGYPLTDSRGRILKNNYGAYILNTDNYDEIIENNLPIFDCEQIAADDSSFNPTKEPQLKTQLRITDRSGNPVSLFNNLGLPLTDEDGGFLQDNRGKLLVRMDNFNFPICCSNGSPIYLKTGAMLLSQKFKFVVTSLSRESLLKKNNVTHCTTSYSNQTFKDSKKQQIIFPTEVPELMHEYPFYQQKQKRVIEPENDLEIPPFTLSIFNIEGNRLTDENGCPLTNKYGECLLLLDKNGFPISDSYGGPIFDSEGKELLLKDMYKKYKLFEKHPIPTAEHPYSFLSNNKQSKKLFDSSEEVMITDLEFDNQQSSEPIMNYIKANNLRGYEMDTSEAHWMTDGFSNQNSFYEYSESMKEKNRDQPPSESIKDDLSFYDITEDEHNDAGNMYEPYSEEQYDYYHPYSYEQYTYDDQLLDYDLETDNSHLDDNNYYYDPTTTESGYYEDYEPPCFNQDSDYYYQY